MFSTVLSKSSVLSRPGSSALRRYFSATTRSSIVLPNSSFLEVSGLDAKKFLQGLCTNDVQTLKTVGDTLPAVLLTTKGRVLAPSMMYLKSTADTGDSILVELHKKNVSEIQRYLTIYRLRSKVTIKPINIKCTMKLGSIDAKAGDIISVADPRNGSLGTRVLSISDGAESSDSNSLEVDAAWYERYKLVHGIADGPELSNRIPLECNLDLLHYISFHKGCYVGQELTARTKFKGLVRKRLVPFLLAADGVAAATQNSAAFEPISEELKGTLTAVGYTGLPHHAALQPVEVGLSVFADAESTKSLGEVVHVDSTGTIGIALIQQAAVNSQVGNFVVRKVTQEAVTGDAVAVTEEEGQVEQGVKEYGPVSYISTYRPEWFKGLDEKTGNVID